MTWIVEFVFCSVVLILFIGYLLKKIGDAGAKTSHGTTKSDRVRRVHQQVDVLLETLGLQADDQLPADVATLARDGNKLEAIKRYRELTGVGLKEAKDVVEGQDELASVERKMDRVLRELAVTQAVAETTDAVKDAPAALDDTERLVQQNRLIEAVKQYRDATGSSLREAKEAVEQIHVRQQSR